MINVKHISLKIPTDIMDTQNKIMAEPALRDERQNSLKKYRHFILHLKWEGKKEYLLFLSLYLFLFILQSESRHCPHLFLDKRLDVLNAESDYRKSSPIIWEQAGTCTSVPRTEFKPTIPLLERSKSVNASGSVFAESGEINVGRNVLKHGKATDPHILSRLM
jgi:hypothetical protein